MNTGCLFLSLIYNNIVWKLRPFYSLVYLGMNIHDISHLYQILVAEAKAHEDKVKEMDEIVEKLKDLCDPSTVEQLAARVTELHTGTPLNHIL